MNIPEQKENIYHRGKIYKIVSDQTDKIYIGSTTERTLAMRIAKHRADMKRWQKNKRGFVSSFDILKYNDARIILIENYPCENKDRLRAREEHHMKECSDRVINRQKAFTGIDTEDKEQYNKEYREKNKNEIAEHKKDYYETNKDAILEQKQDYYETNKDAILEQKKGKVVCLCGCEVAKGHISRHLKTQKHQKLIEQKNKDVA